MAFDFKTALTKIKQIFQDMAFAEYPLADGRKLVVSEMTVGADVTIDGVAAEDATYELEDGSKVIVVGGKITEIQPKEVEVEMATYKLQDGTEVSIDNLAEGGMVTVAGMPAVAGEIVLEDGTKITTDETGKILKVEVAGVNVDAPLQMADLKEVMEKFAAGTPEERLANLETVSKAVMEYCFGWQIRENQIKQQTDAAIAVYKQGFAKSEKSEIATLKETVSKQNEVIKQLFEVVEALGGEPQDAPPAIKKKVQSFGMTNNMREGKLAKYAEAAKKAIN